MVRRSALRQPCPRSAPADRAGMWRNGLGMESKLNGIEMRKFETKEELVEWIETMHLQNTNGRETEEEMFRLGIEAAIEELTEFNLFSIPVVVGRSEQLPCDCGVMLKETTIQVFCPKCYIVVAEFENLIMNIEREVKVRDAIKYCIENFDSQTATNRIVEFWKNELKLQEQQCNIANVVGRSEQLKPKEQICYKSNEPCKYDCSGLCKESC